MSNFLAPGQMLQVAGMFIYGDRNEGGMPASFRWGPSPVLDAPWTDGALWPRSRVSGAEMSCAMLSEDSTTAGVWGFADRAPEYSLGAHSLFKITGMVKDAAGDPVANAIVRGFRSANHEFVREVEADGSGNYWFGTQYLEAHYLVAYKPGSPDIAGTTVNTLMPA